MNSHVLFKHYMSNRCSIERSSLIRCYFKNRHDKKKCNPHQSALNRCLRKAKHVKKKNNNKNDFRVKSEKFERIS